MIRVVIVTAAAALLVGCASLPEIIGGLSSADVREIALLVRDRPDIRKPLLRISRQGPGVAEVWSGRNRKEGDICSIFTVRMRRGRWAVASPINEEKILIAGTGYGSGR
jgi:hypothetical protein